METGDGSASIVGDSLEILSRTLAALELIDEAGVPLTATEVSKSLGVPLPVTLRLLRSLTSLGHLEYDDRRYWISDGSLGLSWSYLSALNLESVLRPALSEAAQRIRLPGFFSVLTLPHVYHADRVHSEYWRTFTAGRAARAPAHVSSSGHVLLAFLAEDDFERYLAEQHRTAYTDASLVDPSALRDRIDLVRVQGYAVTDSEYVQGLRGAAVPVRDASGTVIGSFTTSTNAVRTSLETLHGFVKDELLNAAEVARARYEALKLVRS